MRHFILLCVIQISAGSLLIGQPAGDQSFPPQHVVASFERVYHHGINLRWTASRDGGYIALFRWEGLESEAHYRADGSWIVTEYFMQREQLPEAIQAYLRTHYGGHALRSAGHHDTMDDSYFFVRLFVRNTLKEWRFDREGNYLGEF